MLMQPLKSLLSLLIFTLVFFISGHSQTTVKNYEKEWKKVDELIIKKKLPQTALAEVKKIYTLAKKEKQDAQMVKALVFLSVLQQELREENETLSIKEFEKEISTTSQPARSLMYSLLADLYWSYYNNNLRWSSRDRTTTEHFKKEDIATWNGMDFHNKVSELFLASIKEEKLLQQTGFQKYNSIIATYGYRYLRPTLYDFLAHRALDYFKNDERDLPKPAYVFTIDQKEALAPANVFANTKFITKDSLSLYYKALQLFQRLIKFHANDVKKSALLDVDIQRIEFAYQYGVMEKKEELYEKALTDLTKKYPADSAAAYAHYLVANLHFRRAWKYGNEPILPEHKSELETARQLSEEVVRKFPKTIAAKESKTLLYLINKKEIASKTENVNLPDQPFRSFLNYKNINRVYLRLVKTTKEEIDRINAEEEENRWKAKLALKSYRSWSQDVPNPGDHLWHSVEIKVDALPIGVYYLFISEKENFSLIENLLSTQIIHVSNISYVGDGDNSYFVLHRNTGKPLENATVQVWQNIYDPKKYRYVETKGPKHTTDRNGFFKIKKDSINKINFFEIIHGNDHLFINDNIYTGPEYRDSYDDGVKNKSFLFTDRSIYRPGQLLYFKGLAVSYNPGKKTNEINPNYRTKIILRDANSQKVDELIMSSNEYGSYHGSFRLPVGSLNGNFSLTDSISGEVAYINVEEYKRPKFFVDVEKPKGAYKLGDSITVKGSAKAYAGNSVDGAKVRYRVVRYNHYNIWSRSISKIYPPYDRNQLEVISGETTTDEKGEFVIHFKAMADDMKDEKYPSSFDFEVSADVTDINGETRSDTKAITVSYHAIQLNLQLAERIHTDSLKKISISTVNSNELFEPSKVTITMHSLQSPDRTFRERLWAVPDTFVMSRQEYYSHFPHDLYKDENDPAKWAKRSRLFTDTFTTRDNIGYDVSNKSFSPGWYVIEVSGKDRSGKEFKEAAYVQLYNSSMAYLDPMEGLTVDMIKSTAEPGEKLKYDINTSLNDLWLVKDMHAMRKEKQRDFEIINAGSKHYEINVTEEDRGGRGFSWMFVKHNRFYSGSEAFTIPYTNKELTISYETFRDKVLPGSNEKWKVKISGAKKDKLSAEMLASMYDASLDQFSFHKWRLPDLYPSPSVTTHWSSHNSFKIAESYTYDFYKKETDDDIARIYDHFTFGKSDGEYNDLLWKVYNWDFGFSDVSNPRLMRSSKPFAEGNIISRELSGVVPGVEIGYGTITNMKGVDIQTASLRFKDVDGKTDASPSDIQPRRNFNETAFFLPDLKTNENGDIEFSFTMPEALTRWKFQALAHTKDLALGYSSKEIITQKELMVQPNPPRFLREGDKIEFSAKIVNLTDKELTGQAELQLFDAATNESVSGWFNNMFPNQYFTVAAGQSEAITFPLQVPFLFNKALLWRIVAKAGNVSDGEEAAMPVLTNRMLVTETMPLNVKGSGSRNFKFEKLLNSNSETLQHLSLTVEYTSNPVWYAVQALPYLMEFPYECSEQTWNRFYANALASKIANGSPRIKQIFESWSGRTPSEKIKDTAALLSNLQKNPELKAVLLEETPWVLQAKTEEQQKKNIALLFDMVRMSNELNINYEKLKQMQSENGGFVWFEGGPDNRYITQYIITGIGHLKKLGVDVEKLTAIVNEAIPYLDLQIKKDHDELKKNKTDLTKYTPNDYQVQYLYMRSFFTDKKIPATSQAAYNYFRSRAQQTWMKQSKYMQGMIALALSRTGDTKMPVAILKSLKETSINNEELGRYWKENSGGYYWQQAPIETQALLIEAFSEAGKDKTTVDELKTWLLKNKQTTNWRTTKATAEACYALLLQGTDLLNNEPVVEVKLGTTVITATTGLNPAEAGTGYFKQAIIGPLVTPSMGNISVNITEKQPQTSSNTSWGAVYWQYFENLDNITPASTPLKLVKKLFVETNTDRGPVITPINEGDVVKVGDKIKVRIELRVDRDMEYVHMKDMRASCLEPINVLSGYKWQGGLGYYETTKDASTNFFFDYLRKGTYVFEYPLFVTHTGNFSNGITTIQCMYAPEFSSHSEGIRINVE
jgi:uncharacterized protein YfaS (alpha-2-macroglobulin family)